MSSIVDCPSCNRKLRVPDELLGKKVKCPTCATVFAASSFAPPTEPPPAPPPTMTPPVPAAAADQPHLNLSLEESDASAKQGGSQPQPVSPPSPSPRPTDQEGDYKTCPYCREQIRREATRCRHCGESLGGVEGEDERPWEQPQRRPVRRDCDPHRGSLVLTFGIISLVSLAICGPVGLPFGITAWVLGQSDLKKMRSGVMDPEGIGMTQAGWICGIVGTIITGLYALGCLAYVGFIFAIAISGK